MDWGVSIELMREKQNCGGWLVRVHSVGIVNLVLHFGVRFGDLVEDNGILVLGLCVVMQCGNSLVLNLPSTLWPMKMQQ